MDNKADGLTMDPLEIPEKYDSRGNLRQHPDYHHEVGTTVRIKDVIYVCKFLECDGLRSVALAIGRTSHYTSSIINQAKRDGVFELFKKMDPEQFSHEAYGIRERRSKK